MDKVYAHISNNSQKYMEELSRFLRQKSISSTGDGISECALMLKTYMEEAGIPTRIYYTPAYPIVYGSVVQDESLPTMLVYGHYDVQPAEPLSMWDSDPFEPVIKNGKIYARGSSDDKGQLFAHIKAAQACMEVSGRLPVNVKYIFEGEEEIGSPNLDSFVSQHKDLLRCDVAIFSDSHIHESGRPIIILGLKGMCSVELSLGGANRDLHSKYAAVVESPVWRLINLLSTLRSADGYIKIEGFYDDVRELKKEEISAIESIPFDRNAMLCDLGIREFARGRAGSDYYLNMISEPTCNIAGIWAGYTGEGSKTVLPNEASVKIDMRLVPDQDPADILRKLRAHLAAKGFQDVKIKEYGSFIPSRTPISNKYVPIVSEAIAEIWGQKPIIYPNIGGSGPNCIFDEHLQAPCIVVPFAAADQNNHGPNESMTVYGFYNGIKTCVAIMQKLSEMNTEGNSND